MSGDRPQLRMVMELDSGVQLPSIEMPAGYTLRCFRPDDLAAWVGLMQRNAELGTWDEERGWRTFFGPEWPVTLEGSFLAVAEVSNELAATAMNLVVEQ